MNFYSEYDNIHQIFYSDDDDIHQIFYLKFFNDIIKFRVIINIKIFNDCSK